MTWDQLNEIGKQSIDVRKPSDDEVMIAKIFKGEEGAKALAALKRMTIEKPSLEAMYPDGMNTAIAMAVRNGENNLYHKILAIIRKVDGVYADKAATPVKITTQTNKKANDTRKSRARPTSKSSK